MLSLIVHNDELSARLVTDQMHKVESEISNICSDILIILDEHLIPSTNVVESFVYYRKMKGDYHWYLAEFKAGDEKKDAADQSLKAYETATNRAEARLSPTNSVQLGVALNLSLFYYEIMNSPESWFSGLTILPGELLRMLVQSCKPMMGNCTRTVEWFWIY